VFVCIFCFECRDETKKAHTKPIRHGSVIGFVCTDCAYGKEQSEWARAAIEKLMNKTDVDSKQ